MKPHLFLSGALLLSAPTFDQAPAPATEKMADDASGYDLLVKAGKALLPGPNGGASASVKLPPDEDLKNERLAVARNAPALALVRQALRKTCEMPEPQEEKDRDFNAKMRELARQFAQESDVRFANGNYMGAMNSRLDMMEMGAVIGRSYLISMLVGVTIESIGRKDIDKIAIHLSAAQCREVISRLNKIEARRTTLIETVRAEQRYSLRAKLNALKSPLDELKPAVDGGFPTVRDIAEFKALSPRRIAENSARFYAPILESAKRPLFQGREIAFPTDIDAFTKSATIVFEYGHYRYPYDMAVTQSRMLCAALELRAMKLKNGLYPKTLKTPVDPFAAHNKQLVYRKQGDGYLLYSVGPDGQDEHGAKLQGANLTGDIVLKPL